MCCKGNSFCFALLWLTHKEGFDTPMNANELKQGASSSPHPLSGWDFLLNPVCSATPDCLMGETFHLNSKSRPETNLATWAQLVLQGIPSSSSPLDSSDNTGGGQPAEGARSAPHGAGLSVQLGAELPERIWGESVPKVFVIHVPRERLRNVGPYPTAIGSCSLSMACKMGLHVSGRVGEPAHLGHNATACLPRAGPGRASRLSNKCAAG